MTASHPRCKSADPREHPQLVGLAATRSLGLEMTRRNVDRHVEARNVPVGDYLMLGPGRHSHTALEERTVEEIRRHRPYGGS